MHGNTELKLRRVRAKALSVMYSECVFVAVGIQLAKHMYRTAICGLSASTIFFHRVSQMVGFSRIKIHWTLLYKFTWNIFHSQMVCRHLTFGCGHVNWKTCCSGHWLNLTRIFETLGNANIVVLILCFHASQYKSNETPTWCNTVQVLFLQGHSTCFGRKRPSSGVFKTSPTTTVTSWKPNCDR